MIVLPAAAVAGSGLLPAELLCNYYPHGAVPVLMENGVLTLGAQSVRDVTTRAS